MTTINLDAVGVESPPMTWSWTSKDCMLYALGVGAGVDELAFSTEKDQRVLPTFATVIGGIGGAWGKLGHRPGTIVHGEQEISLCGPLPPEGQAVSTSRITAIYDKGSGAVAVGESTVVDAGTGSVLFTGRTSMFVRGAGGWGGDRGPSAARNDPPDRSPDHVVTHHTLPEQALIYRLSGDYNPLHSDPDFARANGFDRTILHGLCTYGFAGRALLSALCQGDPARFGGMDARFARPVFPGSDLVTKMWEDDDGAAFVTETGEGVPVLTGRFRRRESGSP
jgi:acyl dehydratase